MCRSVIVFPQRAPLVKVPAATEEFAVIQSGALRSFAARWLKTGPDRLTPRKLEQIHQTLQFLPATDDSLKEAHVRMAKRAEALCKREQERRRRVRARAKGR